MMAYILTAAANLLVGASVGLCGVAGFLLPMFYTTCLHMGVTESLALSFAAFIISGILGSANYKKAGNLDIPFGIRLSIGSLIGAAAGVKLNLIIPEDVVKIFLYLVVLLSGISILLRKDKEKEESGEKRFRISEHLPATLLLGAATGCICSLSGAGGPVLVMPLLVVLGIPVRTAVGVALFNSVFIGIPAVIGYMAQCEIKSMIPMLLLALVTHGIGVWFGSVKAVCINQTILKRGIAVFSIAIAVLKLAGVF